MGHPIQILEVPTQLDTELSPDLASWLLFADVAHHQSFRQIAGVHRCGVFDRAKRCSLESYPYDCCFDDDDPQHRVLRTVCHRPRMAAHWDRALALALVRLCRVWLLDASPYHLIVMCEPVIFHTSKYKSMSRFGPPVQRQKSISLTGTPLTLTLLPRQFPNAARSRGPAAP